MNTEKPTFAELLDWLEGRLGAEEAEQIESRLQHADGSTLAELEWLREFLDTAEQGRLAEPPPVVREALVQQFEERRRGKRGPGWIDRLKAVLTFDSATQLAAAGTRSVHVRGKPRQMVYDSDLAEIALNVFPNDRDQHLTLTGQVFPKRGLSIEGLSVQLVDASRFSQQSLVNLDEIGEFTLEMIPPGRYDLYLSAEGVEIALPDIDLQR